MQAANTAGWWSFALRANYRPGPDKHFNYSKWTARRRAVNLRAMTRNIAALKERIGSRIRQRRDYSHMSQEDLAFQADLTTSYLSQIESGKRNPSLEALFRLSTALHVDLAELVKE